MTDDVIIGSRDHIIMPLSGPKFSHIFSEDFRDKPYHLMVYHLRIEILISLGGGALSGVTFIQVDRSIMDFYIEVHGSIRTTIRQIG